MGIILLDEPILYVCDECGKFYFETEIQSGIESKNGYHCNYEREVCPHCYSFNGNAYRKEITDTDIAEIMDGENYWKIREAIRNVHKKKGDND